jgi:hypothetical protein
MQPACSQLIAEEIPNSDELTIKTACRRSSRAATQREIQQVERTNIFLLSVVQITHSHLVLTNSEARGAVCLPDGWVSDD